MTRPPVGKTVDRWIPLQEAFDQLSARFGPDDACERINATLRAGRMLLQCNGTLLAPAYIVLNLAVVARDGRCIVEPHGARLGFDPSRPRVWEVDAKGIEDLLRSETLSAPEAASEKDRGGTPPKYDWDVINFEIAERFFGPPGPKNINKSRFSKSLCDWYERRFGKPPSQGHMHTHVVEMLAAYERWRAKKK
jgi:hypothetical protein